MSEEECCEEDIVKMLEEEFYRNEWKLDEESKRREEDGLKAADKVFELCSSFYRDLWPRWREVNEELDKIIKKYYEERWGSERKKWYELDGRDLIKIKNLIDEEFNCICEIERLYINVQDWYDTFMYFWESLKEYIPCKQSLCCTDLFELIGDILCVTVDEGIRLSHGYDDSDCWIAIARELNNRRTHVCMLLSEAGRIMNGYVKGCLHLYNMHTDLEYYIKENLKNK